MYPATIVRQVTAIKGMMAEGMTIEQIQRSWLRFRPRIEALESDIADLLDEMRLELEEPHFDDGRRARLTEDMQRARTDAQELIERLQELEQAVAWDPERADDDNGDDRGELEDSAPLGRFF